MSAAPDGRAGAAGGVPADGAVGDPVGDYKRLLRRIIDSRPSGMRVRIARALGKHKSFVSQITNPAYAVPLPARHLETIFEICHFSPEERQQFLAAYTRAHPDTARRLAPPGRSARPTRTVDIEVPDLGDATLQAEFEDTLRRFVAGLARVMAKR